MNLRLRYGVACVVAATLCCALSLSAGAQEAKDEGKEYTIKPLPPGGPTPRLADGHPDLTGHWFPNGAGQGVSGRFGVDPGGARARSIPRPRPRSGPRFRPGRWQKSRR